MARIRCLQRCSKRCLKIAGFAVVAVLLLQLVLIYPLAPKNPSENAARIMRLELPFDPGAIYDSQVLATNSETTPSPTLTSAPTFKSVPTSTSVHTVSETTDVVKTRNILELTESSQIKNQGIKLRWIALRMKRMEKKWDQARDNLLERMPELFSNPKSILLFPGLLTEYSAYNFGEMAFRGGFQGELVQWSDFIATIYMLGHTITIATSRHELERADSSYSIVPKYDLLFTDYLGLNGLHDAQLFSFYKCRIRVLDSFGTEPIYNFQTASFVADSESKEFSGWNFEDLRQFWTLFPHTPDNSFLGFVVETPDSVLPSRLKNKSAVIYGKQASYLKGHLQFLEYIKPLTTIHGTLNTNYGKDKVPDYIVNHHVMAPEALMNLLQSSKLFIGLGFPYEGPGPMEALANGCVFIQPKFKEPHNRFNQEFFYGKPTARGYRSQMPYLQDFVGEPYVYTVDEDDPLQIETAVTKALELANFSSFVPYEFTHQGMMERVAAYIQHQNFCDGDNLALRKEASASSYTSSAGGAVDGVHTSSSCYKSEKGGTHWWRVDLASTMTIGKIRITIQFDWNFAAENGSGFFAPFRVTLVDSQGEPVTARWFLDDRIFYLWEEINARAKYVHIDTDRNSSTGRMQLCAVEIYSEPTPPLWPNLDILHTVLSSPGQSCGDACLQENLMCEPAFFRKLNSVPVLTRYLDCKTVHRLGYEYVDYLPAVSVDDNVGIGTTLTVNDGDCIINENTLLLGCAGKHNNFQRLCPCRKYTKGQIALPYT